MKLQNPVTVKFDGRLRGAIGKIFSQVERVEYNDNPDLMRLALYDGKTESGNAFDDVYNPNFGQPAARYNADHLTRVRNDVNGNPRYVIHFLALLRDDERGDISSGYDLAVARAKKLFGGKRFHNRQYGGGIVFTSYNVDTELHLINEIHSAGGGV